MPKNRKPHVEKGHDTMSVLNKEPSDHLRTRLTKAFEIESRLSSLSSTTSSEEVASKLRIQLCEVFSDILLADTHLSARKDLSGRMWRSCFYGRIGELRSRIKKGKSKLNKLSKKTNLNATGSNNNSKEMDNQKKSIEEFEESLTTFLREAVILYEYLVDKYLCILKSTSKKKKEGRQTKIEENAENINEIASLSTTTDAHVGIIPTLHRLYIHLGDLHRYSTSFNSAELSYLKASCLAPGKGNPYNQLAVVAQLKDSTGAHPLPAVALYWYCRSLLAVDDAFETSRVNLERLFTSNRSWIDTNVANEESLNICTVGMNREKSRAIKSSASRVFLSRFVSFHGRLFHASSKETSAKTNKLDDMEKIMHELIFEFGALLCESAFSDALLMKMVSIIAFSIWNSLSIFPNQQQTQINSATVAIGLLLSTGTKLAASVEDSVEKLEAKQQRGGRNIKHNVIRLMTPLLLVCEFISYLWLSNTYITANLHQFGVCTENTLLRAVLKEFWVAIAKVANIIKASKSLSSFFGKTENGITGESFRFIPNDYKVLRGFLPFASFIIESERDIIQYKTKSTGDKDHEREKDNDSYLSCDDAFDALSLSSLSQAQSQTNSQPSHSSGAPNVLDVNCVKNDETKIKVSRFFQFILRHTSKKCEKVEVTPKDALFLKRTVDDQFCCVIGDAATGSRKNDSPQQIDIAYNEADVTTQLNELESSNLNFSVETNRIGDDNEDMIVYKSSTSGKALLVPGQLFLNTGKNDKDCNSPSHMELDNQVDNPHISALEKGNDDRKDLLSPCAFTTASVKKKQLTNKTEMNVTLSPKMCALTQASVHTNILNVQNDNCPDAVDSKDRLIMHSLQSLSSKSPVATGNDSFLVKPPPGFCQASLPSRPYSGHASLPCPNSPSPNIYSFSHNLDHSSKKNEEKKPSVLSSALASYPKAYNNVPSAPLLPPPGFQVRQSNHEQPLKIPQDESLVKSSSTFISSEIRSKTSNPFVSQEPKWDCSDEQVHESKVSRFSFGRDKSFSLSHSQPSDGSINSRLAETRNVLQPTESVCSPVYNRIDLFGNHLSTHDGGMNDCLQQSNCHLAESNEMYPRSHSSGTLVLEEKFCKTRNPFV